MGPPSHRPPAGATPSAAPDLLGSTLGGRFRLDARLGAGGFGVVYRARDAKNGRDVAVKVLREELYGRSALRRRFAREAKALIALSHPNIVAITDAGVEGALPYLAMELLEGRDLGQVLKADGPLDETRVSNIVDELLAGIGHMHAQGLVHRDLKPANVFLQTLADGGERVKLLDFGLAKFLDSGAPGDPGSDDTAEPSSLTKTGEVFGTPGYMPPEQLASERLDHRADLYSVAVIVFQMLSGRRPFVGEAHEVLRQVLVEPPPPLDSIRRGARVQPALEAWLQAGMAKDPDARADSAEGLRASFSALPRPLVTTAAEQADAPPVPPPLAVPPLAVPPLAVPLPAAPPPNSGAEQNRGKEGWLRAGFRRLVLASATLVSFISVLAIGAGGFAIFLMSREPAAPMGGTALSGDGPTGAAPPDPIGGPPGTGTDSGASSERPNAATGHPAAAHAAMANAAMTNAVMADAAITDAARWRPTGPLPEAGTNGRDQAWAADAGRHDAGVPALDAAVPLADPATEARDAGGAKATTAKPASAGRGIADWPARDPFRRPLPRSLARVKRSIDRGGAGTDGTVSTLRNYNRKHQEDARGNLLLARLYLNRRWHRDAIAQYGFAIGRDPSARGDKRMLNDLIMLVETSKLTEQAAALVQRVYGAEASGRVGRARRRALKNGNGRGAARLAALLAALPQSTATAE